ncbi:MAG TPA: hypothetical protein VGK59_03670 [Ohtaekwangia sp.]
MKTTGLIKFLIIVVNATLIFVLPWPSEPEGLLTSPILPFVLMTGLIPGYYVFMRKEKKERLKWPNWNTNLFNPKGDTALGNIDFFGTLFAVIGLSMIVSNKVNYDELSKVGMTSVSFGLGILSGLLLTIKFGQRSKTSD